MDSKRETDRLATYLAGPGPGSRSADAAEIADRVCATGEAIDSALTPIIGKRGVDALSRRSLYLAAKTHPWIGQPLGEGPGSIDLEGLRSVLRVQDRSQAAAGGAEFLQTFYTLLAGLIGDALTERLLCSVWIQFSGALPAQDPKP